jgi:hypothetical protein
MNSFTSSSESVAGRRWGRALAAYVGTLAGGIAVLHSLIIICDPFSTGRFTPFQTVDIAFSGRVEANAGRVRDPRFDSAIIGNSVSTRFQPELLDRLTDRRFVQLSIPGLGPDNELTLARAFVRGQGEHAKTLIFMLETFWCVTDERNMYKYPEFATWLYEGDNLTYLRLRRRPFIGSQYDSASLLNQPVGMGTCQERAEKSGCPSEFSS